MYDSGIAPDTLNAYSHIFQKYPDVVNVVQMCEMLGGISTKTGYELLQANKINHFRIGKAYKIPKMHVIAYLHDIMTHQPPPYCNALGKKVIFTLI